MRLWSLHPKYLDAKGLVALWREGLLAQKVLLGQTRGYVHHPQLQRFREVADPVATIGTYLDAVRREARRRGYAFDAGKIARMQPGLALSVNDGQLACEWRHLLRKLELRCPELHQAWRVLERPETHPLFIVVAGPVADWERAG